MILEILYLLTVILSSRPKTQFLNSNRCFIFFVETFNFQCSSKTHFLDHKFQDPSCRICSYGPHGPFWFSVKKWPDTVKRYQKNENGEKSVFEMTVKMNLFCGGKFWKATFVCRMLPQGLLFLKNKHFWKFQTCPFWKKYAFPYIWAYLVPIGPYLVPIWSLLGLIWSLLGPIWLYWALFGPIGPYWALFGSIGPYLALTVKQKRDTEGSHRGHRIISILLGHPS